MQIHTFDNVLLGDVVFGHVLARLREKSGEAVHGERVGTQNLVKLGLFDPATPIQSVWACVIRRAMLVFLESCVAPMESPTRQNLEPGTTKSLGSITLRRRSESRLLSSDTVSPQVIGLLIMFIGPLGAQAAERLRKNASIA